MDFAVGSVVQLACNARNLNGNRLQRAQAPRRLQQPVLIRGGFFNGLGIQGPDVRLYTRNNIR